MIWVSDRQCEAPKVMKNDLQRTVYQALSALQIPFERVDTDPAITMEDCMAIDEKLAMKTVKTLFLCNRRQTSFYLLVTCGDKPFCTRTVSAALGVSRLSFATPEQMRDQLGTEIGATTVFSALLTTARDVQVVMDRAVLTQPYCGCTDGTTTGYMKVKTDDIYRKLLPFTGHSVLVIDA